jgi:Arc/MetJ family transcription regulator
MLREAGLSCQAIADELGLRNAHAAADDVYQALELHRSEMSRLADLHVTLELGRLDSHERAAQTVLRTAATSGDQATVLKAIDRLVRVSARRSKLLGLETEGKQRRDASAAAAAAAALASGEPARKDIVEKLRDDLASKRREKRRRAGYG